ncbi:Ldh family oxidoreductase [Streptosporangium sp. DT93]|uniref:Ldh family oxidoreductase n=1 Tax=Streptosporangium sp. DT93 TaxID=3393428 RepID=UPI003CEDA70D
MKARLPERPAPAAPRPQVALELRDVVLSVGPPGAERVLLRGADLRVGEGEKVLLSGLDGEARSSLTALLDGRIPPRYGTVSAGRVHGGRLDRLRPGQLRPGRATVVLDAGDRPAGTAVDDLPPADEPYSVLVLAGHGWEGLSVPGRYRSLRLDGGQFVDCPPARRSGGVRVPLADLHHSTAAALLGAGAGESAAETTSGVLVDAERRGHRSHGVALLPTYLRRIKEGGIRVTARPRLTEITPAIASVDACGGLGQPAAELAAGWCAARAAEHGLAAVAIHDNNHVGMLAAYRHAFQEHQVVGFLLNTSGPSVSAPGASRPTLGSNAVCLVTPTAGGGEPFCVDLATGVVAAGKIRDAANRGAPVPRDWLQDASGTPTTDPAALDRDGSIPLFGGYKGLCVTLVAEILAGALAGRRVSPDVGKQRRHLDRVMGCSQLFVGFSARHFAPEGDHGELSGLVQRLREAVLAGHAAEPARPWFPDQPEEDHAADADAHGVEVPASVLDDLGWTFP